MTARSFVVVTSSFPIRGDGSEAAGSFVADLAQALANEIPLRVVAPGVATQRERWSDRIEVLRYAAPPFPLSTLKPWHPYHLNWIRRVMAGGQAGTRAAVGAGAAHVLALWGLPCGEWARNAAREAGIGYSTWLLGSDVWSLGRLPVLRTLLARVIRQSAQVYADGYRLADEACRIGGRPVEFLPSTRAIGSADSPMPRANPPYRLLFLGRWHANKGVDLLLDALAQLTADDWRRIERVEVQGGGPMDGLVRARTEALRAAGHPVEIGGFLDKTEAEAALARADWVLLPSRIESIPVVFSDAMKSGRPVVATPVGDLPVLFAHSPFGVLAADAEASAFARALQSALALNPAACAPGIRHHAAGFDLTAIARRILQKAFDDG